MDRTLIIILSQKRQQKFEGEFNGPGENVGKYKTFSILITKEVKRIYKNGEEITNTYHILQITIY